MTKQISNTITLHRKPKDGAPGKPGAPSYLAYTTPVSIDLSADADGTPMFAADEMLPVSLSVSLGSGTSGFAESTGRKVLESQFPHYHTYMSQNKGVASSRARMRIVFSGLRKLTLAYSSFAEVGYDYLMLSVLDKELPTNVTYSHANVAYHTRDNQTEQILGRAEYRNINPATQHFIDVVFIKDGSSDDDDDRGYVGVPDVSSLQGEGRRTIVIRPYMQNATGTPLFDYDDPRLVLPDTAVCGLTYERQPQELRVTIDSAHAVQPTRLVLPIRDSDGDGGVQLAEVPVNVAYGARNADTITISASCHDGYTTNALNSYVLINGKRIGKTKYFTYTWNAASHNFARNYEGEKPPADYYTGFAFYFIDADTMQCLEVNYINSYSAGNVAAVATDEQITALADTIRGVVGWYLKETSTPIILAAVAADASGCNTAMRKFFNDYGSSLSDTYYPARRRHYFVTNIRTARAGQAYEEVSESAVQRIVTFTVNRGDGVVLQGSKGNDGQAGYDGCLIRRTEWQPGRQYRNDSDHTERDPVTGQYIVDEVTVSSWGDGKGKRFVCQHTHTSALSDQNPVGETFVNTLPDGRECWETVQNLNPIMTPFADITTAFIEFLQARQLVITRTDSTGNPLPYGAFGGGEWPLWFGGQSPSQAVTRVNDQGHLYSQKFITEGQQAHVEIQNGLLSVFGSEESPNIVFGVDEDGYAVLKYYSGGKLLYNLGPQGIMSQTQETDNRMSIAKRVRLIANSTTLPTSFNGVATNASIYQFTEGFKKVGTLMYYKIGKVVGFTVPSSYNNRYFTSNALSPYQNDYDGDGNTDYFTVQNGKPNELAIIKTAIYFSGLMAGGETGIGSTRGAYEIWYFDGNGLMTRYYLYLSFDSGTARYLLCNRDYVPLAVNSITLFEYLALTGQ